MNTRVDEYLNLAKSLALKAGARVAERRIKADFSVSMKSERNPVTDADLEAERIILDAIRATYPSHVILSEETSPEISSEKLRHETVWIVDPIDGTVNYSRGHHQVGVSIAVAEKGEVRAGAVFAPFVNELFYAAKGIGAFCNGEAIKVRSTPQLNAALVATGFPYDRSDVSALTKRIEVVLRNCQDVRRLGAASLDCCWVACGRLDAYYEDVMPWDMAAGALIAREAGAQMLRFKEAEDDLPEDFRGDGLLLATPETAERLRQLLAFE